MARLSAWGSRPGQRAPRMRPRSAGVRGCSSIAAVARCDQLVEIEPIDRLAERALRAKGARHHPGHERSQRDGVIGRRQVKGRAHHAGPHRSTLEHEPVELRGVEALDPAPQADERIGRDLRLHADEVLDGGVHVAPLAAQQSLAGEDRPIERAHVENRRRHVPTLPTSDAAAGAGLVADAGAAGLADAVFMSLSVQRRGGCMRSWSSSSPWPAVRPERRRRPSRRKPSARSRPVAEPSRAPALHPQPSASPSGPTSAPSRAAVPARASQRGPVIAGRRWLRRHGFDGAFGSLLWTSADGRTWRDVTPPTSPRSAS